MLLAAEKIPHVKIGAGNDYSGNVIPSCTEGKRGLISPTCDRNWERKQHPAQSRARRSSVEMSEVDLGVVLQYDAVTRGVGGE